MKNWKRDGKEFDDIIREDLGENPEKWLNFFNRDPQKASEVFKIDGVDIAFLFRQLSRRFDWIGILIDGCVELYTKKELTQNSKDTLDVLKDFFVKNIKCVGFASENSKKKILEIFADRPEVYNKTKWYKDRRNLQICKVGFWITIIIASVAAAAANICSYMFCARGERPIGLIIVASLTVAAAIGILLDILQGKENGNTNPGLVIVTYLASILSVVGLAGIFFVPNLWFWGILYLLYIVLVICYIKAAASFGGEKKKKFCVACRYILLAVAAAGSVWLYSNMANHLGFANNCHAWNWHTLEKKFFAKWRKSGQYNDLYKVLIKHAGHKNFVKENVELAYAAFEAKDPGKCCKNEEAPWKTNFKKYLVNECNEAIGSSNNVKSCQVICDYMEYYRSKFRESPVEFAVVLEKLFKPAIIKYEKGQLDELCMLMDKFIENNSKNGNINELKSAAAEIVIVKALEDIYDKIAARKELENSPESDAWHAKFKNLESKCKKYSNNKNVDVLRRYAELAKERNRRILNIVQEAVNKYIHESDSSAWNYCKNTWIEESCHQIPGACYLLWKYGHPKISRGEKQSETWLKYLQEDYAGKIAESSYYAAEIFLEKQDQKTALSYYLEALRRGEKGEYYWLNDVRHKIVKLTSNETEKWENLWQLYQASALKEDEFVMFARMCDRNGKRTAALETYKKCPEASLNIEDWFRIVELETTGGQKLEAFDKLAAMIEKELKQDDKENIERFCKLGNKINAADAVYNLLRQAVIKGNVAAPELYVEMVKKLKRLDEDAADKLVDNKKFDRQVIDLAKLTGNEALFIKEAKRWEERKYAGYQEHILAAGEIFYKKDDYGRAWDFWSKLTHKERARKIEDKYCRVLDNLKYLDDNDIEFYAERSNKNVERLTRLAEHFENKKDYPRAAYFWAKILDNGENGKVRYKLYDLAVFDRQDADKSGKYNFDRTAVKMYGEMKQPHSLKDNLDKSVELGCKEAIIEKGRLMKTGYLEMSDSEIGEMKSRLRKLLNTQTLTAEERKKVEEYEKFEKKDVEAF